MYPIQKKCLHCGTTFSAIRSSHRFCQGKECAIERARLNNRVQAENILKAQEKIKAKRERAILISYDVHKAQCDVVKALDRIGIKPSSTGVNS
jgi:hypothetical protein